MALVSTLHCVKSICPHATQRSSGTVHMVARVPHEIHVGIEHIRGKGKGSAHMGHVLLEVHGPSGRLEEMVAPRRLLVPETEEGPRRMLDAERMLVQGVVSAVEDAGLQLRLEGGDGRICG